MLTLDTYRRKKLADASFAALYRQECHVCRHTVRIFETLAAQAKSLEQLAAELQEDLERLERLRDADYCDPALVMRLCPYLDLEPPQACPRLA